MSNATNIHNLLDEKYGVSSVYACILMRNLSLDYRMLLRFHVIEKQEKKIIFKRGVRGRNMISWCCWSKRAEQSVDYLEILCFVIWEMGVVVLMLYLFLLGTASQLTWLPYQGKWEKGFEDCFAIRWSGGYRKRGIREPFEGIESTIPLFREVLFPLL